MSVRTFRSRYDLMAVVTALAVAFYPLGARAEMVLTPFTSVAVTDDGQVPAHQAGGGNNNNNNADNGAVTGPLASDVAKRTCEALKKMQNDASDIANAVRNEYFNYSRLCKNLAASVGFQIADKAKFLVDMANNDMTTLYNSCVRSRDAGILDLDVYEGYLNVANTNATSFNQAVAEASALYSEHNAICGFARGAVVVTGLTLIAGVTVWYFISASAATAGAAATGAGTGTAAAVEAGASPVTAIVLRTVTSSPTVGSTARIVSKDVGEYSVKLLTQNANGAFQVIRLDAAGNEVGSAVWAVLKYIR